MIYNQFSNNQRGWTDFGGQFDIPKINRQPIGGVRPISTARHNPFVTRPSRYIRGPVNKGNVLLTRRAVSIGWKVAAGVGTVSLAKKGFDALDNIARSIHLGNAAPVQGQFGFRSGYKSQPAGLSGLRFSYRRRT